MKRLLPLLLLGSCASPREMLETFRIEGGHTHGDQDFGTRDGGSDSWYVGGSFAPFASRPQKVIVVESTHAKAEQEQGATCGPHR